jgi:hypothetical protein
MSSTHVSGPPCAARGREPAEHVVQLQAIIDHGPLADLNAAQYERLRADILAAESTGLKPKLFDPLLSPYLEAARTAAAWDTPLRFLASLCSGIAGVLLVLTNSRLKNRGVPEPSLDSTTE